MKKKPVIVTLIVLLCVTLIGGIGFTFIRHSKNMRIRMLLSVVHFATGTLKDDAYLLHNIDIMEMFRDYGNGTVSIEGKVGSNKMKGFNASASATVNAVRSFPQKKLRVNSGVHVLWMNIGDMNMYAEKETVYIEVPMLENVDAAFPTGVNLFMRMPEFTSDINQKWFKDNIGNIIEFTGDMKVTETGNRIIDPDGTVSDEFIITIPEGTGHFIWELLGMKDPEFDVVISQYLTTDNRLRKFVISLDHVLPGGKIVLDGTDCGTLILTYELPDDELAELTIIRDATKPTTMTFHGAYYTNIDEVYTADGVGTWLLKDEGFELHVQDINVYCDEEWLAEGYFVGDIVPIKENGNLFAGKEDYLYGLEEIDWKTIRNDFDGFVQDIMDKMKGK